MRLNSELDIFSNGIEPCCPLIRNNISRCNLKIVFSVKNRLIFGTIPSKNLWLHVRGIQ